MSFVPLLIWPSVRPAVLPPYFVVPRRTNHTKWFWRDRGRALNERTAISLVVPVLEDAYAVGGELKPVGLGFRESCLSDVPGRNDYTISRSNRRAAIEVRGISRLPVTSELSLTTLFLCTVVRQSSEGAWNVPRCSNQGFNDKHLLPRQVWLLWPFSLAVWQIFSALY